MMFNEQLDTLVQEHFYATETDVEGWRNAAVPEWSGPEDDDLLIAKMCGSGGAANIFGGKATFNDLWTGNVAVLSRSYPSISGTGPYDASSADAALAQHLAFWTGKNHERMLRIMQRSALVRDKWTKHKSYLKMTVGNAVNHQGDVYNNGHRPPPPACENQPTLRSEAQFASGIQYMPISNQAEYFKGCVYVLDQHRVFTPNGAMLKPEQFKAAYGGYEFALDTEGHKSTRNAWEAFTESQGLRHPKVSSTCFLPDLESGAIIEEEGLTRVNVYVPINTRKVEGDPTPFLTHLAKVLPDERDRTIYLSFLAGIVQHPGVKAQWCPILQGAEGNGKTVFSRAVTYAVGHQYTHLPNASDLAGNGMKFNGWILNKILIALEEIYVTDRRELTEPLKVLITNDRVEVQSKGKDQITGYNVAKFLMFSNHKDMMPVTIDTRRYSIFYSAQQTKADIIRDGMTDEYFTNLYDWLKADGYAIVNHFLHTYQIPAEFDFSKGCQRAPETSSTAEAVHISMGAV